MKVNLFDINYEKDPDLEVSFQVDDHFLVLYCKVKGEIKKGSLGNNAADYLFGKPCQYYFQVETYILILDLYEVSYEWRDRLRKSVNFFAHLERGEEEQKHTIILIVSDKCEQGVKSLLEWIEPKGKLVVNSKEHALESTAQLLTEYSGEE